MGPASLDEAAGGRFIDGLARVDFSQPMECHAITFQNPCTVKNPDALQRRILQTID